MKSCELIMKAFFKREKTLPVSDPLHCVMCQSAAGVVAVRVSYGATQQNSRHFYFGGSTANKLIKVTI